MKKRINLVGMPNQRNIDSLQTLLDGKDQRFKDGFIIPIRNPITGQTKYYFEKRPGLEQSCLAAFGDRATAIHYSSATGKTLAFFEDADGIATPYVDCVDVGPFDLDVTPVDRGDGRLVAVNDGGGVFYSVDNGVTWSTGTSGSPGAPLTDVAWGGTYFMAVGKNIANTTTVGMISTNGETYSTITLPTASPNIPSAWSKVRWVNSISTWVIGHGVSGENYLAFSTDNGSNWTVSSNFGSSFNLQNYDYSTTLGRWVAIGTGGANAYYSDDDGVTWSSCTITIDGSWRCIKWSDRLGLFIAGSITGITAWSDDGITFTDSSSFPLGSIIESDATLTGISGTKSITSTDGKNWTQHTISADIPYAALGYNGQVFFAGTYGGSGDSASATNGEDWTEYSANQASLNYNAVTARWI